MKDLIFRGVCTALVTPFERGDISISMLRRLLTRQLDAGIKAILICGTTGESPTLSDSEKLTLIREAKSWVGKQGTILAGTGSNCTEHAVSLSKAAQDVGADALLVVTPYYNKATPAGLIAHYTAIAQAVSIPVIIYNVPSRTGVDIPISVYKELSQLPNIAGVKEASTDLHKIARIRATCQEAFSIWSGNDDLTLPVVSLGGSGVISVTSNVCPQAVKAMTDAALQGELETAQEKFTELLPLMEALFSEVNPIPVKAAMEAIGLDCGCCRLPLTSLSPQHKATLNACLKHWFS